MFAQVYEERALINTTETPPYNYPHASLRLAAADDRHHKTNKHRCGAVIQYPKLHCESQLTILSEVGGRRHTFPFQSEIFLCAPVTLCT